MATDDADADPRQLEGEVADEGSGGELAVIDEYTWDDFLREHGEEEAAEALYERFDAAPGSERWGDEDRSVTEEDWERTGVDPADFLGFPPWELEARIGAAHRVAEQISAQSALIGYEETPVVKDIYNWEDYKREYFYDDSGNPPTDGEGQPREFDRAEALGFDPEQLDNAMADHGRAASELQALVDERTVDVADDVDEDEFFSNPDGTTTIANRYDLEKTVPLEKKQHFREIERYWLNRPFSYVVIFHSTKEDERKYYAVEPHLNEIEDNLTEYLTEKLRAAIKYSDEGTQAGDEQHRRSVIEDRTYDLLERYDLYTRSERTGGFANQLADSLGVDPRKDGTAGRLLRLLGYEESPERGPADLEGIEVRPEPAVLEEDSNTLTEYQVEKLLYYLQRDFVGYERIDPIKNDINVEDISCDGYNSPVFVYHSDYEQIITNIYHGEEELDDFVVKLAQRSGKGISKSRPQVDATLPDGSRAQLTLGSEVSAHGTNYTIRQFKEIPFTPIDLINWHTFSLDQIAFLWLCIENNKSILFAGGTASGKTTSLNAVSLFIPSNTKIVSIEDTREVELPQRNWIASVTRPSFTEEGKGNIDEFDLLEAALRQRPDYIVMGEVRGEEGRTLFQIMSTGHTTYTTFHADNVSEVLKRFTTDPINVSKTMFTALDLVSIQTQTRVQGTKVRRNKSLTEINHYDAENDEINVQDVYQWQAESDEFLQMSESNTLEDIMFDRGWDRETLDREVLKRRVVLAYLIYNGLNTYTQVAATLQAFSNDPETIISLMADDMLEASLEDLREMESVLIDIDPEKEERVPRPDPSEELLEQCEEILERAEVELFSQYRGETPGSVADALSDEEIEPEPPVTPESSGELPPAMDALLGPEAEESARSSLAEPGEAAALEPGDLPGDREPREIAGALRSGELEPADVADELEADDLPGEMQPEDFAHELQHELDETEWSPEFDESPEASGEDGWDESDGTQEGESGDSDTPALEAGEESDRVEETADEQGGEAVGERTEERAEKQTDAASRGDEETETDEQTREADDHSEAERTEEADEEQGEQDETEQSSGQPAEDTEADDDGEHSTEETAEESGEETAEDATDESETDADDDEEDERDIEEWGFGEVEAESSEDEDESEGAQGER